MVDTSGAGDLFKAGVIYAWLQDDWPLEQKVKFACAAAGLGCERDRSKDPPPSLAEILRADEAAAKVDYGTSLAQRPAALFAAMRSFMVYSGTALAMSGE